MPPTWNMPEYLERKKALADDYRSHLREGDAAPAPLRAVVSVAAGTGVRPIRMRDHTVISDAGAALGGYGLGPTAPELLLGALASCLAHSALVIAADRGIVLEHLEVEVTGRLDYRGTLGVTDEAIVPPTDLAYTLRFDGGVSAEDMAVVEADIARFCPVLLALTQPMTVTGRAERAAE